MFCFSKNIFFFFLFKMRFSIQEEGKNKKIFHSFSAAQKETGVQNSVIEATLQRTNSRYHRKSDNKFFLIQKEPQVKILTINGEDFFSLEEIQPKFGLSQTKLLNQLKNKTFPQKIDWISPEIFSSEFFSSEKSEVDFLREELEEMKKTNDQLKKQIIDLLMALESS